MTPFLFVFRITVSAQFENYGSEELQKPNQVAKF